jgi:16S rRNA (guanine527-N7)-methyltransferase
MQKEMFHVEQFNRALASSIFSDSLSALGIKIDQSAQGKIMDYFALLLNKNEQINLISPKQNLQTKVIVHLTDSLTPLIWPDLPAAAMAMDFGSGGGLPAIPLAIVQPDWQYTLIESTGKKTAFLSEAREALALNNVIVNSKFLEPGKNTENINYDLITARGVSDLTKLFALAGPRLKQGGFFIAFKGPQGEYELDEAEAEMAKRKMQLYDCLNFKLPGLEAERRLFIFQKM